MKSIILLLISIVYVNCHPSLLNSRPFELSTQAINYPRGYHTHRISKENLDNLHETEAKQNKLLNQKISRRYTRSTNDDQLSSESDRTYNSNINSPSLERHYDLNDSPNANLHDLEDEHNSADHSFERENSFSTGLINRFRHYAGRWLSRIRDHYLRSSINLFSNDSPIVFRNSGERSPIIRINDNTNNEENRSNDHPDEYSAYTIPSTSSAAPFVEETDFVSPPDRDAGESSFIASSELPSVDTNNSSNESS